jgi:hypothetical protein
LVTLCTGQAALYQLGNRLPNRGLADIELGGQQFFGGYLVPLDNSADDALRKTLLTWW